MADERYNIVFFKRFPENYVDKSGNDRKGVFRRIGNAIARDDGSFLCFIDSIPLNWDGQFKLYKAESQSERETRESEAAGDFE